MFLWKEIDKPSILDNVASTEVDSLKYLEGALIWHIKKKDYNKSGLNQLIKSPVYKSMTVRNCNTLRKLASLME